MAYTTVNADAFLVHHHIPVNRLNPVRNHGVRFAVYETSAAISQLKRSSRINLTVNHYIMLLKCDNDVVVLVTEK